MRCWAFLAALLLAVPAWATPPDHVISARYLEPTDRYDHGVLGDAVEWGALEMVVDKCLGCEGTDVRTVLLRLPASRVFEDVAPRLIDIEGDGTQEVMVVETLIGSGARLAVYEGGGGLVAATPYIGRNYRWLAPVGAADLDGDGFVELAYVDRPHLAKTLRVWRYVEPDLVPVVDLPGLTNHRIGEADIGGGLRDCGDGVEMITADAAWSRVMATRLEDGALVSVDIGPYAGRTSFAAALACER